MCEVFYGFFIFFSILLGLGVILLLLKRPFPRGFSIFCERPSLGSGKNLGKTYGNSAGGQQMLPWFVFVPSSDWYGSRKKAEEQQANISLDVFVHIEF